MDKTYDEQYIELGNKLLNEGKWDNAEYVRTKYADGTLATTISLLNQRIEFDNSKDSALLTSKKVATVDPIKEILWIWQDMSNDVNLLESKGCTVWNEWKNDKGEIGKSYGWQLKNKKRKVKIDKLLLDMSKEGKLSVKFNFTNDEWDKLYKEFEDSNHDEFVKLNQVDYLLYSLKKNPYSRRIKTTLYCIENLDDMALEPCVYETHWQLWDNKLHLTVNIRSNDYCLGNSYNVYQYSLLHKMIAQVSELEVGTICFNIDNLHVYDRHIKTFKKQINGKLHHQPTVWINPNVTSFYDFTIEDVKVKDYKHNGKFKYEIAI